MENTIGPVGETVGGGLYNIVGFLWSIPIGINSAFGLTDPSSRFVAGVFMGYLFQWLVKPGISYKTNGDGTKQPKMWIFNMYGNLVGAGGTFFPWWMWPVSFGFVNGFLV